MEEEGCDSRIQVQKEKENEAAQKKKTFQDSRNDDQRRNLENCF